MNLPSFDQIVGRIKSTIPGVASPKPSRPGETVLATLARPTLPPEAFEARRTAAIKNLSEHRRLELMILTRLLHRIFENDFHGGASDPNHPDTIKARRLLADAMVEPINGLPIPQAEKILNWMNRLQVKVFEEAFDRKTKRGKIADILWHTIRLKPGMSRRRPCPLLSRLQLSYMLNKTKRFQEQSQVDLDLFPSGSQPSESHESQMVTRKLKRILVRARLQRLRGSNNI